MPNIKLPNAFIVIFIIMIFVAVLTYILPAGSYSVILDNGTTLTPSEAADVPGQGVPIADTYQVLPKRSQNILDVLSAPVAGILNAIDVSVFIMMVGGLIGIMNKTGAINVGISFLMRRMQGKEKVLIIILTFLFSLGGTTYGMYEETIGFYLLLLPIMLSAGYDSLVVAAVILGGASTGCLASTINPFAVGVAAGFANISLGIGLGIRVIFWFILTLLVSIFVSRYADKVLKDPKKSLLYGLDMNFSFMETKEASDNQKLTRRQSIILIIFLCTFLLMTYSLIPFSDFNITVIPTLSWWFPQLATLFLFSGVLIGIVGKLNSDEFIDSFIDGMKDVLVTAMVVGVARGIVIIMNNGLITATILNWAVGIVKPLGNVLFIIVLYFLNMILGFFITSTSGLATLTMPIFGPLADFVNVSKAFVINAYAWGLGIINFITPSSGVVMGSLILCKIPWGKWVKFMAPILGVFIVLSLLFLGVCVSMNITF